MIKLSGKTLNFFYSIGAAIIILGAFFKTTHTTFGGVINPVYILGAGLLAEAVIFIISAFNYEGDENKYAWENVYPELLDANAEPRKVKRNISEQKEEIKELEVSLSKKLDQLLSEAKLDAQLFEKLKIGIEKFSSSVEQINHTVDISQSAQKYSEQLALASSHLEKMNLLYVLQLENGKSQSEFQQKYVSDLEKAAQQSEKFNEELNGLTANLNNLNRVYGGMLTAMKG